MNFAKKVSINAFKNSIIHNSVWLINNLYIIWSYIFSRSYRIKLCFNPYSPVKFCNTAPKNPISYATHILILSVAVLHHCCLLACCMYLCNKTNYTLYTQLNGVGVKRTDLKNMNNEYANLLTLFKCWMSGKISWIAIVIERIRSLSDSLKSTPTAFNQVKIASIGRDVSGRIR